MNTIFRWKTYRTAFVLLIGLNCALLFAGQSHNVVGELRSSDGSTPSVSDIEIEAWIISRPNEILTNSSPGCGYGNPVGWWHINIGNFPTDWDNLPPYSDTLRIVFKNTQSGEQTAVTWAINGDDNLGVVQLQSYQPPSRTEVTGIFPAAFTPAGREPYNRLRVDFTTKKETSDIEVMIYDIKGRELNTYQLNQSSELITIDGQTFAFFWNGKDGHGSVVSAGIYIYQINVDGSAPVTGMFGLIR